VQSGAEPSAQHDDGDVVVRDVLSLHLGSFRLP
jgi:hypothetical protein